MGTARGTYGVGGVEFVGEIGEDGGVGMFGIRGREVRAVVGGEERSCDVWEGLRG